MGLFQLLARNQQRTEITRLTDGSLAVSVPGAEVEKIIARTKEDGCFIDLSEWRPFADPRRHKFPSDAEKISRLYRTLGAETGAKLPALATSYQVARLLLDPKHLAASGATPELQNEAAQALERIELTYRILCSPVKRAALEKWMIERAAPAAPEQTIAAPGPGAAPPPTQQPRRRAGLVARTANTAVWGVMFVTALTYGYRKFRDKVDGWWVQQPVSRHVLDLSKRLKLPELLNAWEKEEGRLRDKSPFLRESQKSPPGPATPPPAERVSFPYENRPREGSR